MTTAKTRPHERSGLQDLADPFNPNRPAIETIDQLRELAAKLFQDHVPVPTVAADLNESLTETNECLELALGNVGYLTDVIRSKRARRLARRRNAAIAADTAPVLDTFDWVLGEALDQLYELTGVLGPLLEPPRSSRTRYGRRTGIFITKALDPTRCGTPAGYRAHLRRGQDACQPCRKAIVRYNADHRSDRAHGVPCTVHIIDQIGGTP
jgi:hypothetical protein